MEKFKDRAEFKVEVKSLAGAFRQRVLEISANKKYLRAWEGIVRMLRVLPVGNRVGVCKQIFKNRSH